ncbi:hypothetical protein QBC37DRAFT_414431 [Rhypophila decipiens]|uniref:HIT-type domain-containing protein n=1 Tax=Rhypophila decipiens TaxID=261697 RepID=A0AAN6YK73_9PEZI|nr:hypothetical protein QBC37DRAFT_414431 [Rhypophila decipiens]
MNNFGVIEVASTKTKNAPGWAYVPDVGPSPSAAALQPANRKRARNQTALSLSDLSARQDAKIRKELEALDRDIHKDAAIPIPTKGGGASRSQKHTPNVRKISQSQKTFANHLDDYQALLALAETNPAAAAALMNTAPLPKPATAAAASSSSARNSNSPAPTSSSGGDKGASGGGGTPSTSKRSAAMAKRAALATANEKKKAAAAAAKAKAEAEEAARATTSADQDVEMTDAPGSSTEEGLVGGVETSAGSGSSQQQHGIAAAAPEEQPKLQPTPPPPQMYPPDGTILPPYKRAPPLPHEGDNDPLLVSYVPSFPTDDELRALFTAPPLSYLEARAAWGEEESRYPSRSFCDVCGYWGRVRCLKCGVRTCALACLNTHKEECVTRYGL